MRTLTALQLPGHPASPPGAMNLSSASSTEEKAVTTVLWGCELSQERRTWTFRPQLEGKQNCRLLLHTICLGEKAKEEMHRVEILPPANQEDKKMQPVTIASLQASVLPMVTMVGVQLSPPVTFQLRAGSGPVFLCGQESYEASDLTWEEEEEEEGEEEEEEEEDDEDEDADVSLEEESPVKQVKRLVPQKQTSVAKVGEGVWLFGRKWCPYRSTSEGWATGSLGQPPKLSVQDGPRPPWLVLARCSAGTLWTLGICSGSGLCPNSPNKLFFGSQKKKLEKEQEETRASVRDKSPAKKAKATARPKKPGFKK
ncbi:nucleoplasmin-2 isoform X1 [Macaca mulatta]